MLSHEKIVIHALIPARGGSKSIPKKNIKKYKKYPLLVHSINSAKEIPCISRVVVSTDSLEIKKIAVKNGADVPFLRPYEISGDLSPDLDCFEHYLQWLKINRQILPDIIIHLRPTYPERNNDIVSKCLKKFISIRHHYDSLRSVIPIDKSLFKMYTIDKKKMSLRPTYKKFNEIQEPYNQARQILPVTYLHNGCVDIINKKTIENGSMTGNVIYPFVMSKEENYDIDTTEDWNRSLIVQNKSEPVNIPSNISSNISSKIQNNNDYDSQQ